MLLPLLVTSGCHRLQTPVGDPPTLPPWEDFLVDHTQAVPADPDARAAEIDTIRDGTLAPREMLRLADLILADAVVQWRKEAEFHIEQDRLTTWHDIGEATDPSALQAAWARYRTLIEEHPETPGLERAIIHLVLLEEARNGDADLAYSPELIESWRQVWPDSPAITGAELLWFSHTTHYCHTRRLTFEAARSLWQDPNLERVLGFDERLARGDLKGFNEAVALAEGLSIHWGRLCSRSEGYSEACEAQNASFRARVLAAKERAIPVYEAVLATGWEPEVADRLYWLAKDTGNKAKAEALALQAEEAGAYEQAMWYWEWLRSTNDSPEQQARVVEHEVAMAARVGRGDMIAQIADEFREKDPEEAVRLYLRVIEIGDSGGSYRYGVSREYGRGAILRDLAKVWRATGKIEEASVWFESHVATAIWRESAPREAERTGMDVPAPER
ncbi:MAG TPA: hypothetical protein PKW90_07460 [Myxococcota bacterium]|nr:hypothetical protein [Myxococcota bacterium]